MTEYLEYNDQNIYEFLKNSSYVLIKKDNYSKNTIIQIINNHLIKIINNPSQISNFFSIINSIIFKSHINNAFIIYPIIYSFNQKLTINYIDYFLASLKQSILEEKKSYFSFFVSIFSDIINIFYNNDNDKDKLIDSDQKENLFQKFLEFINENIKSTRELEQSFACMLLIELIEMCPLIKEEKFLGPLFQEFSLYLDDGKFKCKLDLLNCIITLIFTVEQKFQPYATVCLFRILDYLTDNDWMKRKLAITIVYFLVLYCKEQILAVKENIIELLNILKEDIVEEVREVCLQTLKFIEESEKENENDKKEEKEEKKVKEEKDDNFNRNIKINNNKVINIINNIYNDYTPFLTEPKRIEITNAEINKKEKRKKNYTEVNLAENRNKFNNLNFTKYSLKNIKNNNRYNIDDNNDNNNNNLLNKKGSSSSMNVESHSSNKNKMFNYINKIKSNNRKEKRKTYKKNKIEAINLNKINNTENNLYVNSSYNNINKVKLTEGSNYKRLMKSTELRKNNKNLSKKLSKIDTNYELRKKYNKEKLLLKEIEKQIKAKKIKIRNALLSSSKNKNNSNLNKKNKTYIKIRITKNKKKKNIYENKVQKEKLENSQNNKNNSINNNIKNRINNQLREKNESNENKILMILNNIQESQNNLLEVLNNLKNTVDMNYLMLDKRIKELERYHDNMISKGNNQNNNNNQQNEQIDEKTKLEKIKNEFMSGKYNEALNEAKIKDYYLYELLPLITSDNIHKIDLSILEYIISELIFKLTILCKGEGNNNIDNIICFFNLIIRAKIDIKSNLKINLKNTLQLIKKQYLLKISQNDITNIDNILKSIKI